ncbi:PHB depolymerase family esterase [Ancylobacter sp. IITR112]|uniref:extracellular catalytic domain type 1 short-chain-length polyhydroxyalkanoate depolymerase n=1 Tax=Ancylobacter sp. IITR112 TaxID=3138073 RepID=UPI00352B4F5C
MRTMSDTMAQFAALGARQGNPYGLGTSPGRLESIDDFGSNPGQLRALCYRPPDLPDKAPLVVVLHGCKQNAGDYDLRSGWSQLADQAGFALLYPEQNPGNNPNLCFNWFRPGDARRDRGEALSIRQMIATMIEADGLDRDRVFVTGLSAGGAMANVMLATYPEVFAGGAIIAGLAYGCASTVPEAFDCMRGHAAASDEDLWALLRQASSHTGPWPRVAIWQGMADHTVAPSNAEDIAAQWRSVHHLDAATPQEDISGGRVRRIWRDAAGEAVIELNTVAAMGHGTPLGGDLGTPGPFMLDVGISSTREIARFWGIAAGEAVAASSRPAAGTRRASASPPAFSRPSRPREASEEGGAGVSSPETAGGVGRIKGVIEQALRAAGLMN